MPGTVSREHCYGWTSKPNGKQLKPPKTLQPSLSHTQTLAPARFVILHYSRFMNHCNRKGTALQPQVVPNLMTPASCYETVYIVAWWWFCNVCSVVQQFHVPLQQNSRIAKPPSCYYVNCFKAAGWCHIKLGTTCGCSAVPFLLHKSAVYYCWLTQSITLPCPQHASDLDVCIEFQSVKFFPLNPYNTCHISLWLYWGKGGGGGPN